MIRDNFISQLVDKLDDMELLDVRNYANAEEHKADIKRYLKLYMSDYIIIEGGRFL